MEHQLSDKQREEIWYALSDAFVDNEVDYEYIADRVKDIDIPQLKEIFFKEVAPVCGPNGMSTVPVVWAGFMKEDLIPSIRSYLRKIKFSPSAWYRYIVFVYFCKWYFKDEWESIVAALEKRRQNQSI